jgi:hypothetical protein
MVFVYMLIYHLHLDPFVTRQVPKARQVISTGLVPIVEQTMIFVCPDTSSLSIHIVRSIMVAHSVRYGPLSRTRYGGS